MDVQTLHRTSYISWFPNASWRLRKTLQGSRVKESSSSSWYFHGGLCQNRSNYKAPAASFPSAASASSASASSACAFSSSVGAPFKLSPTGSVQQLASKAARAGRSRETTFEVLRETEKTQSCIPAPWGSRVRGTVMGDVVLGKELRAIFFQGAAPPGPPLRREEFSFF